MMTLLCGFFIMMFSMAKMDEPQYEKVKEAVAKHFGGDYKSASQEMAKFISQVLHEAGVESDASVKSDPSGVSIVFKSTMFFESLSSDIRTEGKAILNKLIEAVASRQDMELKKYRIVVEGHTDGRPIVSGEFATNWELSGARAARVVRMFLDRGFLPDRLAALGYADTHPAFPERRPSGELDDQSMAKNRRVVIRILEPKVDAIPFPEAPAPAAPVAARPATSAEAVPAASLGVDSSNP
jgi:chemotaxis protein MotB